MKCRIVLLVLCILLNACASKKVYWLHDVHGRVESNNPVLSSDRAQCDEVVYGQGLEVNGEIYIGRDAIIKAVVRDVVADMKYKKKNEKKEQKDHWPRFEELQKEGSMCLRDKGWTRDKNS